VPAIIPAPRRAPLAWPRCEFRNAGHLRNTGNTNLSSLAVAKSLVNERSIFTSRMAGRLNSSAVRHAIEASSITSPAPRIPKPELSRPHAPDPLASTSD